MRTCDRLQFCNGTKNGGQTLAEYIINFHFIQIRVRRLQLRFTMRFNTGHGIFPCTINWYVDFLPFSTSLCQSAEETSRRLSTKSALDLVRWRLTFPVKTKVSSTYTEKFSLIEFKMLSWIRLLKFWSAKCDNMWKCSDTVSFWT